MISLYMMRYSGTRRFVKAWKNAAGMQMEEVNLERQREACKKAKRRSRLLSDEGWKKDESAP